jgi:chemotaxis protein MotB
MTGLARQWREVASNHSRPDLAGRCVDDVRLIHQLESGVYPREPEIAHVQRDDIKMAASSISYAHSNCVLWKCGAVAQIEILNAQISALRRQIAALEEALGVSEKKEKESQLRIADLGQRLNVALAQRAQELSHYRSDFFGKLREILGNRPDIRVVGDRFVFQSELFFDSGSAVLRREGRIELDQLAAALPDLDTRIPSEINWVLRVDGHTDTQPTAVSQFKSNWDLSAARAISVVQYLISKGVSPKRLVAAGFGEFT